jgi:hypothetical protein
MPTYNITGANVTKLQQKIDEVKLTLEDRRTLWANLPQNVRDQWKISCPDPVLQLLYQLYLWLKLFFGEA